MERTISWFGLAAGITTLVLVAVSVFVPWWQLTVGDDFASVYASPIVTNFGFYGAQFTLPLLWAWNLSNILLFTAGGVIMLVYSVFPTKSYSKDLLCFSYKKPLYGFLSFVVGLAVIVLSAGFFDLGIPLVGTANVNLSFPSFIPLSASISSSVTAMFLFPFYLAIAAVVLCVAARFYHVRLIKASDAVQSTEIAISPANPVTQ
ncbi:MAG: hypothetical protein ACQCN6_08820 [Candidatus Bathyarchaeia archaeon]|jgi:hypothetical protein